jgi:hypothetical protein
LHQILTTYCATGVAGMAQVQLARLYESRGDPTSAVAMYEVFLQRPETAPHFKLHAYGHVAPSSAPSVATPLPIYGWRK